MALFTTVIAVLMVVDALFTWANFNLVESALSKRFPRINIKLVAFLEGISGLGILIYKVQNGFIA